MGRPLSKASPSASDDIGDCTSGRGLARTPKAPLARRWMDLIEQKPEAAHHPPPLPPHKIPAHHRLRMQLGVNQRPSAKIFFGGKLIKSKLIEDLVACRGVCECQDKPMQAAYSHLRSSVIVSVAGLLSHLCSC